jgi:geranylgeranyl reductase family protein
MTYDALIVGGGPAGLVAARTIARRGFSVVVCEEHERVGQPVHCTGVLGAEVFDEFELSRSSVLNALTTVHFFSPAGLSISHSPATIEALVIDRAAFDADLARQAREAGAELRASTRVTSIAVDESGVRALAGDADIRARLVLLACGANYSFQRRLGLGLPQTHLQSAQREFPARRLRDVELYFGSSVAPSGFGWAVPVARPSGPHVRVGVMAARDPAAFFESLVARLGDSWGIEASSEPPRQKILPLGPIERTYDDRLLVLGDAAGLVKPTTGGGIYYSLMSGSVGGDVAATALRTNRVHAAQLADYESRWRRRIASELDAQAALRHVAESLTDADIDALFNLAATDGIMPIVRKTARFNHHRHLVRALFRHPPARKVLFRSLMQ